jgi:GNAT superfamily N-acetyltransferase
MTTSTLNLELRLAQLSDLAQIAPFLLPLGGESFANRFGDGTVEGFYRWKYFANPLGEAIVGIASAGGTVVSVVAAVPKRIWISGKIVLAYELGDFLTDASFRKKGLFSQLIELVCREVGARGASLVYVRPNEVSYPILARKLSFQEAQRLDARRFVIPSQILFRKTGVPAGLLRLSGMDLIVKRRCIPRYSGSAVTVVSIERFAEDNHNDIDQLWQRASAGYDFALLRDSSYLNWRFADCPTPYEMWAALRNSQTVGYLVTSADRSAPVAAVVDLFTENGDEEAVRALLATGMGSLLKSGAQTISTWTLQGPAQSAAHELLRRAVPMRRKQHLHLVFRDLQPQELNLPLPSQKWHFTLGDCDGA